MPLRWTADGKSLYVQNGLGPLQIYRIDAATERGRSSARSPPRTPPARATWAASCMTADAGTMVYSHHRVLSDLYLVTALD